MYLEYRETRKLLRSRVQGIRREGSRLVAKLKCGFHEIAMLPA